MNQHSVTKERGGEKALAAWGAASGALVVTFCFTCSFGVLSALWQIVFKPKLEGFQDIGWTLNAMIAGALLGLLVSLVGIWRWTREQRRRLYLLTLAGTFLLALVLVVVARLA